MVSVTYAKINTVTSFSKVLSKLYFSVDDTQKKFRFIIVWSWIWLEMCVNKFLLKKHYGEEDSEKEIYELASILTQIWNLFRISQEAEIWNGE